MSNRDYGWMFHLDLCKSYNNYIQSFPSYVCMCKHAAWDIGNMLTQLLLTPGLMR